MFSDDSLSAVKGINLLGKGVWITPGADDMDGKFTSKMTQDALTRPTVDGRQSGQCDPDRAELGRGGRADVERQAQGLDSGIGGGGGDCERWGQDLSQEWARALRLA